jgi:hypothetical protein
MAGTTTNFAIPYPSSTDYVTDGATAMKSIADQVDAVLFTGSSSGNLLINGAMQVTQRSAVGNVVTGITSSDYYAADRWKTSISSLGTFSQTTLADAPAGSGFRNCSRFACTTADASPAAGDYLIFHQAIEGQNLQAIRKGTASAQTVTLSFWVASFQTGTFIVELEDSDNSRAVSKSYTVNASNTWEYKTITFPADITGVLDNDANGSMILNFWLGAGTTYTSGTLQTTWGATTNANRAVGVTNLASSTSNKWHITGAQLTVGSVATPFQFKSYAQELLACQRYYFRQQSDATGNSQRIGGYGCVTGGNTFIGSMRFPVTMRTRPTGSLEYSGLMCTDNLTFDSSGGTWTIYGANYGATNNLMVYGSPLTSASTITFCMLGLTSSTGSYIAISAEL